MSVPTKPLTPAAIALELAHGMSLLERVAQIAEDAASPRYTLDAAERHELGVAVDKWAAWRDSHPKLLAWARRQGVRIPGQRVDIVAEVPR